MNLIAKLPALDDIRIAVIGLGYVGLPLAVEFAKSRPVVGFDINTVRIAGLQAGKDATLEVSNDELAEATHLSLSSNMEDLRECNVYIVTVPTPIDVYKRPDLTPLRRASEGLGTVIGRGDIVIYESTVYPGATEEDCVPILECASGLNYNTDFFAGYSPERINPGDKAHRLPNIRKVTSGSTPDVAELVDQLYATIITAGTYKAESIRVAEAAKVIENTQRDLNIALVNELATIFHIMGIDTDAVLRAAETKWNFLPFRPGLVGGHCIGVDPYYLTHKAESLGYHPEIILAGRRLNDGMGAYAAGLMIKKILTRDVLPQRARVLVLGLTFKENCPDLRNTKVIDLIKGMEEFGAYVDVHDPWVSSESALDEFGLSLVQEPQSGAYDGIILAVPHEQFVKMGVDGLRDLGVANHIFFDLKSVFPHEKSDIRL